MRFSDRSFTGMFWELYLKAVSWVKVGLFLSWDLRLIFRCDAALRLHFSVLAGSHCFNVPRGRLWFIYPGFVSCVSSPSLYSSAQKECCKIWEATFDLIHALHYIDMPKMICLNFVCYLCTESKAWESTSPCSSICRHGTCGTKRAAATRPTLEDSRL